VRLAARFVATGILSLPFISVIGFLVAVSALKFGNHRRLIAEILRKLALNR
jgi:hypothetical protein